MPRRPRLDAPGTLHHVIARGIERRKIVRCTRDYEDFLERIGTVAFESATMIYAWALMPNHIHLLIRSGPLGISHFMRRLLTGYAINFNRRHNRTGHLFQNRYKSIVCEEDPYFQQLVCYIHLNPLRSNIIDSLTKLDRYKWTGHSAIMGNVKRPWQDVEYVLSWFSQDNYKAKRLYRNLLKEALRGSKESQEPQCNNQPTTCYPMKHYTFKSFQEAKIDNRILGSKTFAHKILAQAGEPSNLQGYTRDPDHKARGVLLTLCQKHQVSIEELKNGSRRKQVCQLRRVAAYKLVMEAGLPMTKAAKMLGVTTPAISIALKKYIGQQQDI